jgi:glycosyltransferase involved in cell wall biosynthesis
LTRVLFLTESFHPVLGGGEAHVRQLATYLVGRGLSATVMTRRSGPDWPLEETLEGVRVVRLPPSGPGRTGKYAMAPRALAGLLREAFDVLVVRGTRVLGLPGLLAARWLRRAVVLQCEVSGEMCGEIYTWGTRYDATGVRRAVRAALWARNRLFSDADALVAISRATEREFLDAGLPADRLHRIPHGVDTRRFRPASAAERQALRGRLGLPADARLIVFTGRLLRGKGIEVLVAAFRRIARDEPAARLLLVGSGRGQSLDVEDALRDQVEAAGLAPRVSFVGRVENVEDWLRASDVFAFPSFFEAMPLSVIEAAACGLACVASDVGGIADVIEDGEAGWLVAPGDEAGLAGALGAALEPASALARGRAARGVVEQRFDFERSAERYRTLFVELGARASGRAA